MLTGFVNSPEIFHRGNIVQALEVRDGHPGDEVAQAVDLRGAVVLDISVPLVDDIVMLSVEPSGALGITAEEIDHDMVVPSKIDITGAAVISPNVAALAINHRHIRLDIVTNVVEMASRIGVVAIVLDLPFPIPTGFIGMPGVDVALDMVLVAGALVLDKTGRIQTLGQTVHRPDPLLGVFGVHMILVEKSPSLVEIHVREYRRMVIIPLDLSPETVLPILTGFRDRLAPEVRGVSHDQQTKFVRPVKLAGDLHLDVNPVTVQSELL